MILRSCSLSMIHRATRAQWCRGWQSAPRWVFSSSNHNDLGHKNDNNGNTRKTITCKNNQRTPITILTKLKRNLSGFPHFPRNWLHGSINAGHADTSGTKILVFLGIYDDLWSWPFGDFDLAGIWTETFWAPDRSPCHVSPRFSYKSSKAVSTSLIALARSGDTRTASTLLLFFASGSFHVWRGAQLGKMSSLPFTLRPLKNSDFHLKFLRHCVTFFILFCAICVIIVRCLVGFTGSGSFHACCPSDPAESQGGSGGGFHLDQHCRFIRMIMMLITNV